jgi:hypothetical protein
MADVSAELMSGHAMSALRTGADYDAYIRSRTAMWKAVRKR